MWIGFTYMGMGLDELENQTFLEINISELPEGTYHGVCDQGRWKNEVDVVIEVGAIASITTTDDMMIADSELAATLFDQMKTFQNLDVDAVAGATVTSNAYKLAVQDALQKAANR
jgi:uncharacterized protein with FMN-binding domain